MLEAQGISPDAIRYVTHGTTLITNTLIERKGAKTALLTTAGFRDAIEIGNEGRYDMYDLALVKPAPLVERPTALRRPGADPGRWTNLQELDSNALEGICAQLERRRAYRSAGHLLLARLYQPRA